MLKINFKKMFTKIRYKKNKTYYVSLDKIKIQKCFLRTAIGKRKWGYKLNYYFTTGKLQSEIVLNHDFVLVDGYSSCLIAKKYGHKKVKVRFE